MHSCSIFILSSRVVDYIIINYYLIIFILIYQCTTIDASLKHSDQPYQHTETTVHNNCLPCYSQLFCHPKTVCLIIVYYFSATKHPWPTKSKVLGFIFLIWSQHKSSFVSNFQKYEWSISLKRNENGKNGLVYLTKEITTY